MRRAAHRPPPAHPPQPIRCGRVLLLASALLLSGVAGWQAWHLWSGLPGIRLARLTQADYERAARAAEAGLSREARQGLIAANVSNLFTSVLQHPEVYSATHETLQRMISELRDTQLGRLQLAGFIMLEADRAGTPVEQYWPRLAPLLSGLDHARFSHFLVPLEDSRAEMYRALGLRGCAARGQAEQAVGQPHGPLLQYLAPRLGRLARSRAAYGDGSDVLCRRLLLKLLRQWTLDDGPPGIRLLAADLLARAVAGGDLATSDPASDAEIGARLRQWRGAYRTAAAARPPLPYPIGVGDAPDLYPDLNRRLATSLSFRMWLLGALFAAGLVAVVSLAFARGTFFRSSRRNLTCMLLAAMAAVFVLGGIGWTKLGGGDLAEDVRRLAPEVAGLPRTPVAAFCALALALPLTALPRPGAGEPRRARVGRVAVISVWACLLIGLCSLMPTPWGSSGPVDVPAADRFGLVAGQQHVDFLDALRAWQP